jgi:hypothetical protein
VKRFVLPPRRSGSSELPVQCRLDHVDRRSLLGLAFARVSRFPELDPPNADARFAQYAGVASQKSSFRDAGTVEQRPKLHPPAVAPGSRCIASTARNSAASSSASVCLVIF